MQTEMLSSPTGGSSFACWQTNWNFNIFSNKSQGKKPKRLKTQDPRLKTKDSKKRLVDQCWMLDTRKKFYRRERGGRRGFLDRITGFFCHREHRGHREHSHRLSGLINHRERRVFLASLVSSASSALKASFRHRNWLSATGSFCNAPFVKLTKKGFC